MKKTEKSEKLRYAVDQFYNPGKPNDEAAGRLDTQEEHLTTNYTVAKEKRTGSVTREEFENQGKILEALAATSSHLAIDTDITTILEGIAESVVKALGAQKANFWDFTSDRKSAYIIAAYGMQDQYIEHSKTNPLPLGSAWVGRAMTTGQAWSTSDVQKDPLLPKSWLPVAKKQNYHGLLCVPLKHADKIIGSMCIYHQDKHEWKYFEYEIMSIVANQAATALMNARTFEILKLERQNTLNIINSLHDGLVMYDNDNLITLINPKAKKLLGIGDIDIISKKITEISVIRDPELKKLFTINDIQQTDYSTKEIEIKTSKPITLKVTRIPVHDEKLKKIGIVQILHDTTEEREIELMKSNFVSVASHQIRTPLTGIRWAVNLLQSKEVGELNEAQLSLLEKISTVTVHFVKLINDLLDVSRIDEGRMDYTFKKNDVFTIVQNVCHLLSPVASSKSITLNLIEPKQKLPKITVDADKIDIAVQNLVDNAIKYSEPEKGQVDVTVNVQETTLMIIVKDNGIGIPENQKKFLFNKFFRADNAVRTVPNGSGLGLYITKEIVEMHSGTIHFESTVSKGSTFTIQIPIQRPSKEQSKTA